MSKVFWISILVLGLAVPSFAVSANWITNGDFESGLAGWTEGIWGNKYVPAQTFDATAPMSALDYAGTYYGTADAVAPYAGSSLGWVRTGQRPGAQVFNFVSQTVTVPAGTYNIANAAWKAMAFHPDTGTMRVAAMLLVRKDGQIGSAYDPNNAATFTFRSTAWCSASQGNWIDKSTTGSFTTTTGQVQFILAYQDITGDRDANWPEYAYVGFDSLSFTTVEAVPEPSSLLALFTGAAGLTGFAIRRRR